MLTETQTPKTDLQLVATGADKTAIQSESDVLDPAYLRAVADLADGRGAVRFTPGGGVILDKPLNREERKALPLPVEIPARFLDLPQDRFHRAYNANREFAAFIDRYTVPHMRPGYRLVVIPAAAPLSAAQLRLIADIAEAYGHSTIRATAGVSIRLPNVPVALLRPLASALIKAGLWQNGEERLAA